MPFGTILDFYEEIHPRHLEKIEDLEHCITKTGPENIAAFIAEPVLASGGVIVPPQHYHKKTLELYNSTSISIAPSFWLEPFGRTAMESAAHGCATITSKKGGLLEEIQFAGLICL